jgi:hypothetical protein
LGNCYTFFPLNRHAFLAIPGAHTVRTYTDIFNPGIFNPSIWVIFPLHLSVYATWWARAAKSTLQHPARAKSFITFQC